MKKILLLLAAAIFSSAVLANQAKIIVPVAPGATMDDIARIMAPELSKRLGKNFLVENKPGASGILALSSTLSAPSDGNTVIVVNNGVLNIAPMLNPKSGVSSESFISIGLVGMSPLVLVTGNDLPVSNIKELVAYTKNNPGKVSWASPGVGTNLHLLGEVLKNQYNLDMVHILYKGMSQAMIDVSEGRVTMFFDVPNPKMFGFFEVNKMKPIAVTGNKRWPGLPNVPTVIEQGVPSLNTHAWFGLSVPVDTPEHIVVQLRQAVAAAIEEPEVKEKLKKLGLDSPTVKANDAQKFVDNEKNQSAGILKRANIKVE